MDYLNNRKSQTGLDLSLMNVEVTSVAFMNNQAQATVAFRPKDSSSGMSMNYVLERRGDKWVVSKSGGTMGGANPHGGAMGGAPGMANPHGGAEGMPTTMPPGHPPVDTKKTETQK